MASTWLLNKLKVELGNPTDSLAFRIYVIMGAYPCNLCRPVPSHSLVTSQWCSESLYMGFCDNRRFGMTASLWQVNRRKASKGCRSQYTQYQQALSILLSLEIYPCLSIPCKWIDCTEVAQVPAFCQDYVNNWTVTHPITNTFSPCLTSEKSKQVAYPLGYWTS